jgi:hypothetical protein
MMRERESVGWAHFSDKKIILGVNMFHLMISVL